MNFDGAFNKALAEKEFSDIAQLVRALVTKNGDFQTLYWLGYSLAMQSCGLLAEWQREALRNIIFARGRGISA